MIASVFERCYTINVASPLSFFLLCPCPLPIFLFSLLLSLFVLLWFYHRNFSVYILFAFSKRLCLFLRVPVCDSLTIILEEMPWVACQSQLTTNPSWVERGIFHINHGIWLWASHCQAEWTAINRLPLHVVTALSNTKADCSNDRLYSREKGLLLFLCVAELVIWYYQAVKFNPWSIRSELLNLFWMLEMVWIFPSGRSSQEQRVWQYDRNLP